MDTKKIKQCNTSNISNVRGILLVSEYLLLQKPLDLIYKILNKNIFVWIDVFKI